MRHGAKPRPVSRTSPRDPAFGFWGASGPTPPLESLCLSLPHWLLQRTLPTSGFRTTTTVESPRCHDTRGSKLLRRITRFLPTSSQPCIP